MQQYQYMCTSLCRSNDKGSNPGPAKALAALGFQDIYLITSQPSPLSENEVVISMLLGCCKH